MLDILIKNGNIVDGTGNLAYIGDIGIKDGKLILNPIVEEARDVIDVTGLTINPG